MRSPNQVARAKRAKRTRRALQFATGLSVLVLSCSVYEPNLLSGRGALLEGGDSGAGGIPDAGGSSSLPDESGGAATAGGRAEQAGAQNQAQGGDASTGEAGAPELEAAGSSIVVTYGGTNASTGGSASSAGGSANNAGGSPNSAAGSGGTLVNGGAGASGSGSAGSAPVARELAKNKAATASSIETGNEAAKGNDGDLTTRWCAVSGTMPQWWRVDLGAAYKVTQVVLKFEHPDRKYTYVVETSPNDAVFTQQAMVSGSGATQAIDMPSGVSARYVRITVTAGAPSAADSNGTVYPTWASFWEMNVYGY